MWHLILPPLIIIFGIGLLLWFFSRRMDDPSFLSRVRSAKGDVVAVSHSRSLSRKAFFLKLLEKTASRFKTSSLRMHNFFQRFLERLREKRKVIDEMRLEVKEAVAKKEIPAEKPRRSWFGVWRKNESADSPAASSERDEPVVVTEEITGQSVPESADHQEASVSSAPKSGTDGPGKTFGLGAFRRIRQAVKEENAMSVSVPEEEVSPEPVLKKTVTRPERPRRGAAEKKNPREESLIARIADNPRDAVAYEELGDLYLDAENMQDAKACYRQVLKLHPTNRVVKLKIRKVERFFEEKVS